MTEKVAPNITPQGTIEGSSINDQVLDNLVQLATSLEKRATTVINWYLGRKDTPKLWSQWIRGIAIGFTALGGLCPLVANIHFTICGVNIVDPTSMNQWGYILIAIAGALVLADRYFGWSNAWMRFMSTQMALQRALEKFQLNWTVWQIQQGTKSATKEVSDDQLNAAIGLLSAFQSEIGNLVDQEFQSWINDFKEQLSSLQSDIAKSKEEQMPGNIIVMIDTTITLSGSRQVLLDQRSVTQTTSNAAVLPGVAPGSHLVTVKTQDANQKEHERSQTVNVSAGQTAVVTMKFDSPPDQIPTVDS